MPHETELIATIVGGLCTAFVLGAVAHRLKLSPLIGYLLAGVLVGPFTAGYVADQTSASQLAEIGVILLMFGVGLHFSLRDLLSVKAIAIPGALVQMTVATLLGMGLAHMLDWSPMAGFVFGLSLSCASTVVLLRALRENRALQTERGRIAVGWLIVEDLAMVLALVAIPALASVLKADAVSPAGGFAWLQPLGITVAKIVAFVAFMLVVGRRAIPWILHYVAHTGSRELFRLAVLAIALGVSFGASSLFGVSFAIGAFFAGMLLAESELSQRAAEETLPLRDAFAVLFFVSVGMLFNPRVVITEPWPLLGVLTIILVGKSTAALVLMHLYRRSKLTSYTVAASLAQIGEFSFILAGLGVSQGLLPPEARDLILAGAIISIMLNPLVFAVAIRLARPKSAAAPEAANDLGVVPLTEHTVVIGYGRVGEAVAADLELMGAPFVVVDIRDDAIAAARARGFHALLGNCAEPAVIAAANLREARQLIVAIPEAFEAGQIVEQARRAHPKLNIVARAHSDDEVKHLRNHGADIVVMGEREIAARMIVHAKAVRPPEPDPSAPLILDDVQHALLEAFREIAHGPHEKIEEALVLERAAAHGFTPERMEKALAALKQEGYARGLEPGFSALEPKSYLASSRLRP